MPAVASVYPSSLPYGWLLLAGTLVACSSSDDTQQASVGTKLIPSRCSGTADEVAMIGDSYLALSGDVARFLEQYSGQTYRTYYANGTQMAGGLSPTIPEQAAQAYEDGATETIIMTGGGNDILIGDGSCRRDPGGEECLRTVHTTLDVADGLIYQAADNGVKEIVYFFYPHLPGSLFVPAILNQVLDYAAPLAREVCEDSTLLDCTFIDTRAAFEGHPEFIGSDGVHPTEEGSRVIAELIWADMEQDCEQGLLVP